MSRAQRKASTIARLRAELDAALRAYDAEVIGRRDEVTALQAELGRLRAELARVQPPAIDWQCG
jgi:HAMP domain-containing protein